ncbi:bifunctional SulP family inorganic anion transporter/carbonic anhydrase [Hamadaea sp. NPDC050747]|uniref:bifunctional SulP family inorganic anion transporter/carbonic anhydrase n=1 Tax=Hamadaea sp. NPDC050747 TaxID=3155789 RepID=UPI0033EF3921
MSLRREFLAADLPASITVALLAVPLSLGIAAASGAPPIAGLVAAVVGGLVAGGLSGAPLQVSGPAAGLTVIVLGLVADYGWATMCAITLLAGLVQVAAGFTRRGRLALNLPPAVVHGMLAGIGVVIVLSQLCVVLGVPGQETPLRNLVSLPTALSLDRIESVAVGAITVGVLLGWPRLPYVRRVPAALAAVATAAAVVAVLGWQVPRLNLPSDPFAALTRPVLPTGDWGGLALAVLTVALIASVETLLSAVAVDKLHSGPHADLDRELLAQGAANTVSGLAGGLPITGVIVRSSANVAAGARTRASTILHGVWVAALTLAGAGLLELVPLAALSALLVVVGARLVNPGHMRELRHHREILPYLVTAIGVVAVNLVAGVALGVATAAALGLWRLSHSQISLDGDHLKISGSLLFFTTARLTRVLRDIPPGRNVHLDLRADFLDHAAQVALSGWVTDYRRRGGNVAVTDPSHHLTAGKRPARRKPVHRWLAPHHVTPRLETGLRSYHAQHAPPAVLGLLAGGQQPSHMFIGCADSHIVPHLITGSGPGDQFCVRNIGNLVPRHGEDPGMDTAVDYAVTVLGVTTVIVCGHAPCGGIRAALRTRHGWLRHAALGPSTMDDAARLNVVAQLDNLATHPAVATAGSAGRLRLIGLYADTVNGTVARVGPDGVLLDPEPLH